jgi:hypothetical protein
LLFLGMGPKPGPDGTLAITLPMGDKKLPGIAAEDIGKCAFGIFKRGEALIGQHIGVSGDQPTGAQMAAGLAKALGQPVVYNAVTPDQYRSFGFPGADDLGNMFQYKRDFETEYAGLRDVGRSKSLNPELQSYETWLERNKAQIPMG